MVTGFTPSPIAPILILTVHVVDWIYIRVASGKQTSFRDYIRIQFSFRSGRDGNSDLADGRVVVRAVRCRETSHRRRFSCRKSKEYRPNENLEEL